MAKNYLAKKKSFLLIFIILISLNTYSQCIQEATNFGNNTTTSAYNVSGDIALTLNTDQTITLDLAANFSTANGPDVRAFLANSEGLSFSEIENSNIDNLQKIEFGLVSCFDCNPIILASGEKSFTIAIPSDVNIEDFDLVFFYCQRFSEFWDVGSFTPFTSDSCTVLSTEENTLTDISIYPNPASTTIQLSNIDSENTEIRIFDLSGKKVFQQLKGTNTQNSIDVSNLNSGLYVLSITEENKKFSKKLMIQ